MTLLTIFSVVVLSKRWTKDLSIYTCIFEGMIFCIDHLDKAYSMTKSIGRKKLEEYDGIIVYAYV